MTQALFYRRSPSVQRILLLTLTALTLPLGAQEQAPRQIPTFKAASNTVVLDLVVTDRKNRVVNDLGCDDFVVYENEIVQEIQSCQGGRQGRERPEKATPAKPATPAAARTPEPPAPEPNFIVFLVDYSTTEFQNQKLVQDAVLHYVNERLGPDDLVAVFFLGSGFRFLQGFTHDRSVLSAVLKGRDVTGTALAQGSGVQQFSAAESSAIADAGSLPASSGGAGAGQAAAAAGAAAAANAQLFINARVQAALSSMRSAISARTARGVLAAIEAISRGVAPISGRKTMVLFSQGFVVGPHMEPELARTVDAANRANVAVYTIDSSGLAPRELSADLIPQDRLSAISARGGRGRIPATGGESLFDRARTVGSDSQESSLRYVASATGGLAFRNTNDLALSLDRVSEDIHAHYVLSYQPRNQDFDGEFRNIRVEVKRPGLAVRTRSGYYAIPPGTDGVTGDEYHLLRQARAAAGGPGLPFDAALSCFPASERSSRVSITIELPAAAVSFRESEGLRTAALAVIGLLRGEDGYVFSRVGTPVNVKATPEEYKVLRQGSLSFSNSIEVPSGRYSFEVFVRDQNSGKASIRDYSLTVAPLGATLTASSIVLSSEVRKTKGTGPDDYLSFGEVKVLPSARRQFRNGDNLVYLFYVYNTRLSAQGRANLLVRSVFESPGKPLVRLPPAHLEQAVEEDVPYVPVARYVALDGLVAGHYFLTVEIEDLESKQSCTARTPFEILP